MDNLEAFVRRLESLANQNVSYQKRYDRDAQSPIDVFRDSELLQWYRFLMVIMSGP